jgi:hypothetical protein
MFVLSYIRFNLWNRILDNSNDMSENFRLGRVLINRSWPATLVNVRFRVHYGLKSDIEPSPKSASDIEAFLSSEAFLRDLEAEAAVAKLTPTDRAGAQPARLAK